MQSKQTGPAPASESRGAGLVRRTTVPVLLVSSLLVAGAVTLDTVQVDAARRFTSVGGYTWSLLLWYLPIAILLVWFVRRPAQRIQRPAFWTALGLLLVLGFGLDYLFAHRFFLFPYEDAVLLPGAPALGGPVPSEEYLFYIGGFLFILLVYIWCDEDFLERYNVPDYLGTWTAAARA